MGTTLFVTLLEQFCRGAFEPSSQIRPPPLDNNFLHPIRLLPFITPSSIFWNTLKLIHTCEPNSSRMIHKPNACTCGWD